MRNFFVSYIFRILGREWIQGLRWVRWGSLFKVVEKGLEEFVIFIQNSFVFSIFGVIRGGGRDVFSFSEGFQAVEVSTLFTLMMTVSFSTFLRMLYQIFEGRREVEFRDFRIWFLEISVGGLAGVGLVFFGVWLEARGCRVFGGVVRGSLVDDRVRGLGRFISCL